MGVVKKRYKQKQHGFGMFWDFHMFSRLTYLSNQNHPRSRSILRLYLSCKSFEHLRDRTSRREKSEFFCFILGFWKQLLGFSRNRFFGWFTIVTIVKLIPLGYYGWDHRSWAPSPKRYFLRVSYLEFQVFANVSERFFHNQHGWNCCTEIGALELLQVDLSLHLPTWTNSSLTAYGSAALPLKYLPLGWYLGHFAVDSQGFRYSPCKLT